MDLGLKLISGAPGAGRTMALPPGRQLLLGRHGPDQGIDFQLLPVDINRRHCLVWRDEAVAWVRDLDSRNGTFVNGSAIPGRQQRHLLVCDRLQLGPARLRLVCLGPLERFWLDWGGGIVPALAGSVREKGWQGQGSVLHDALLDAGCGDAELLRHCRDGCPHGVDCSLLDLLLDESQTGGELS
jgi:hypothetical protein